MYKRQQPQRSSRRRNQPGCRIAQGLDGHRIAEHRIRPGEDSKRHTAGSGIENILSQSAEGLLDDADGKEVSGDHWGKADAGRQHQRDQQAGHHRREIQDSHPAAGKEGTEDCLLYTSWERQLVTYLQLQYKTYDAFLQQKVYIFRIFEYKIGNLF